jgi:hypothetical protein
MESIACNTTFSLLDDGRCRFQDDEAESSSEMPDQQVQRV